MATIDYKDSGVDVEEGYNAVNEYSLFVTVATCIVIGAYYFLVKGMSHTTFWDGIRETPQLSPYITVGDVCTEFTLEASTGRQRPTKPDTTTCVTVLTIDEYLEQAPANIIQQIIHTVRDVAGARAFSWAMPCLAVCSLQQKCSEPLGSRPMMTCGSRINSSMGC